MIHVGVDGEHFDAANILPRVVAGANSDEGMLEGFDAGNGQSLGNTPPDMLGFPQQVVRIETLDGPRIAVCAFTEGKVYVFNFDGEVDFVFPLDAPGRGIIQLNNSHLLISTTTALVEYSLEGDFIREILNGRGFRYLSRSSNYQKN